jgi:hypothetical protein
MTLEQLLETQLETIKTHRGGARFEYQKGPRRIVKINRIDVSQTGLGSLVRRHAPWNCNDRRSAELGMRRSRPGQRRRAHEQRDSGDMLYPVAA